MNIASQLESIVNIKTAIRLAIRAKGVVIPDNTPFSEYARLISTISGSITPSSPYMLNPPTVQFISSTISLANITEPSPKLPTVGSSVDLTVGSIMTINSNSKIIIPEIKSEVTTNISKL